MHSDSPEGRSFVHGYEQITSTANAVAKLLRSLDRKKARVESGLFLAEGARLVAEGVAHGWEPAFALAGPQAMERERTLALLENVAAAGGRVLAVTEKVLASVAQKDNPQTIVAAFRQRLTELHELPTDGPRRWLALYEVRDPGNLGTIVRTADAAGVDAVLLVGSCCDPFSVEAVRATMGSLFAMRLVETSFDQLDIWRKRAGARMIAASMHGQTRPDQIVYGERSVVLMGNEQAGLPADVERACDQLAHIPMRGAADSLNLASASSLMIYEVWRSQGYPGAARPGESGAP